MRLIDRRGRGDADQSQEEGGEGLDSDHVGEYGMWLCRDSMADHQGHLGAGIYTPRPASPAFLVRSTVAQPATFWEEGRQARSFE